MSKHVDEIRNIPFVHVFCIVTHKAMTSRNRRRASKHAKKVAEKSGKPIIAKFCPFCEHHHLGVANVVRWD